MVRPFIHNRVVERGDWQAALVTRDRFKLTSMRASPPFAKARLKEHRWNRYARRVHAVMVCLELQKSQSMCSAPLEELGWRNGPSVTIPDTRLETMSTARRNGRVLAVSFKVSSLHTDIIFRTCQLGDCPEEYTSKYRRRVPVAGVRAVGDPMGRLGPLRILQEWVTRKISSGGS